MDTLTARVHASMPRICACLRVRTSQKSVSARYSVGRSVVGVPVGRNVGKKDGVSVGRRLGVALGKDEGGRVGPGVP